MMKALFAALFVFALVMTSAMAFPRKPKDRRNFLRPLEKVPQCFRNMIGQNGQCFKTGNGNYTRANPHV